MKNASIIAGILAIILSLTMACGDNQPVKIGLMIDITGRVSQIGISGRNGAELARNEINQNGGVNGKKLEFIVVDDNGSQDKIEKRDQDLINKGIVLGVGHLTSGPGMVGYKVFKKANILMISPTMSTTTLKGIDDIFLRLIDVNSKQGEVLAQHALLSDKNRKFTLLYEESNKAYTTDVVFNFKRKFEGGGGKVIKAESYISSNNYDLSGLAERLIGSGATGFVLSCGGVDLGILTQKLKKLNPDISVYSGMWGMTEEAINKGGKAIEGTYFAGTFDKKHGGKDYLRFKEEYKNTYGKEPDFSAAHSYETVKLIGEILNEADDYKTETLKKLIIKKKKYKGLMNDFNIDKYGDTDRGYMLLKIEKSSFVKVK